MNRISAVFATKKPALIPFIMGFDGGRKTTLSVLDALVENGADIIEIGVPFSDPMADGPVIQAAGIRALQAGATLAGVLDIVKTFRIRNDKTPIILMGYYNPIYRFGAEAFAKAAKDAGVDGLIVVDLPPEEEQELTPYLKQNTLDLIRLVAPTSTGERLKKLCDSASGFIYYIAVAGITGAKSATADELTKRIKEVRVHTKLPIAIGFGIKTPEQAAALKDIAEALVVGSALVDLISKSDNPEEAAGQFTRQFSNIL
jgi:tryptophan synthase alpha chain